MLKKVIALVEKLAGWACRGGNGVVGSPGSRLSQGEELEAGAGNKSDGFRKRINRVKSAGRMESGLCRRKTTSGKDTKTRLKREQAGSGESTVAEASKD